MRPKNPDIQLINHHKNKKFLLEFYQEFVQAIIEETGIVIDGISVIAVDDDYLRDLHARYLGDDTFTDVMTFPYHDEDRFEAEIYISLDRAEINADRFGASLLEEVARLVAHGILHLTGLDDHNEGDRLKMRAEENRLLKTHFK